MTGDLALAAPFPWFGGKSRAAAAVWAALGDVGHFVEPFFGSGAVLLGRPTAAGTRVETANDADGYVANAWRAIRGCPDEVAEWADGPVNECDIHARHVWLLAQREDLLPRLMGAPDYCDPKIAGWWIWGISAWIGSGWCSGQGPWGVVDGRFVRLEGGEGVSRQLPSLGGVGVGVHKATMALGGGAALREWMQALAARLRHVRVCCGDWRRVTGHSVTDGHKECGMDPAHPCGVFLVPPYSRNVRAPKIYSVGDDCFRDLAAECCEWALEAGRRPTMRVVLAGFEGEGHEQLKSAGWRCVEWWTPGFSSGGYAMQGEDGTQQHRERLWCSPACLVAREDPVQVGMFERAKPCR